jgi:hypothetical protein
LFIGITNTDQKEKSMTKPVESVDTPDAPKTVKELEAEFMAACQADLAALKALQAKFDALFKARGIDLSQKTPRKR